MTDRITLHCFAQSGHSYKAALMLALCELDWEPVWIDFFRGAARSPEFRAVNPMGECPVLTIDGEVMTQSGVMLDYLSEKTGKFRPAPGKDHREALRWILWENHKLNSYLGTFRFMRIFAPEKVRNEAVTAFLQGRAIAALEVLEQHLTGRDWVATDDPTIADIACSGYVHFPGEEYGWDWDAYPNLQAWKARMAALPGWKHPYDLMPGAPESWRGADL